MSDVVLETEDLTKRFGRRVAVDDLSFLDDNIGQGSRMPNLGHLILERCAQYAEFPSAINTFITTLITYVGRSLNPKLMDEVGIDDALAQGVASFPQTQKLYERLAREIKRQG